MAGPADPAAPLAVTRPARVPARLAPGTQDHRLPAARSRPAAPPAAHLHADAGQAARSTRPAGATRTPGGAPGRSATQRSSLVRSGAGMAVGTLVSRGTGFLRTLVLVYAIGTAGLGNAYNNANTLPNTVYYLMLGGIFTSVVVPLLVRAAKRDPDRGEAYTQRLFTLGALSLLGVTVLATLLAAPLVTLYAPSIQAAAPSTT